MKKRFFTHLTIAVALLLGTSFYISFLSGVPGTPITKSLDSFPYQLGTWHGTSTTMKDSVLNILGVEDYMMRKYSDGKNHNLWVYVGYYESQSEGDIIHSPKHCLPGTGWQPVASSTPTLQLAESSIRPIKINKYLIQKGTEKELVLYWYHSRGRVVASEYLDKFYLIWDSIFKKRSDGALVRLSCRINPDEEETLERMEGFLNKFYPVLQEYLPGA